MNHIESYISKFNEENSQLCKGLKFADVQARFATGNWPEDIQHVGSCVLYMCYQNMLAHDVAYGWLNGPLSPLYIAQDDVALTWLISSQCIAQVDAHETLWFPEHAYQSNGKYQAVYVTQKMMDYFATLPHVTRPQSHNKVTLIVKEK